MNKPKFHHQWLPDMIMVENGFPQAVTDSLKAMGYEVNKRGQIGRTEVIKISRPKKKKLVLEAVGDNRGDDDARAY